MPTPRLVLAWGGYARTFGKQLQLGRTAANSFARELPTARTTENAVKRELK
jgi:hypothetical protein